MKRHTLVISAVLLLGARDARPQAVQNIVLRNSFNPIGAGARGLGMGGAFIAVGDDGTAASFNPAGLAQLRRTEIALVGFGSSLTSDLTFTRLDNTPGTQHTQSRHRAPDFAGIAVPFELSGHMLTVQVSYQRSIDLFGEGTAVTQDTFPLSDLGLRPSDLGLPANVRSATLVAEIAPTQKGAFHTLSLSGGYQVNKRLSLGIATNYWIANWTADGSADTRIVVIPPVTPAGVHPPPVELSLNQRTFRQEQSLHGLNLATGVLLKYPRASLGGILRLPFAGDYALTERDRVTQTTLGRASAPEDISVDMTSELHWPLSAGIGLALRPLRGLTLGADYTRSHWSRTALDSVPQGALLTEQPELDPTSGERAAPTYSDLNFFDLQAASQTTTVDTSQLRVGGEYLLVLPKVVVPLRGGWFQDRSPVVTVGSQNGRRIRGFTMGTGLNLSRVVLDVAFERRHSSGQVGLVTRGGRLVPQAQAPQEKVREDRIVASLIYRFSSDDDPLKRALRYLFVGEHDGEPKGH